MTNVSLYLFLAVLIVDKLFFNPNITGGNNIWNWVLWSRYHVGNITITIQLNNTTITLDTASSTHNTQNITFPQFCFNPFYHLLFSRAATLAYQGRGGKLVPKYGRYKCGKNVKSLPKVRKIAKIDMKWAKKNSRKMAGLPSRFWRSSPPVTFWREDPAAPQICK